MKFPRRTTLQLTPLFDMLLIVIFAQYLEVRETQVAITQRSEAAVRELAVTKAEIQQLRQSEEELRIQMQTEQGRRLAAEEDLHQAQSDLDRTLAQQRVLGELVTELFQIPPADVEKILTSTRMPALDISPQNMQRLKERFRELSLQRGGRMIEHLLSYDEIRKRCDVWQLHIDSQGIATLTADDRTTRLRIPTTANDDVDVDALVRELYDWYRSLPQPKTLVVILLTYDRGARISVTEAVRRSLPILVRQMQADHSGRIRFEYADLGFRLE